MKKLVDKIRSFDRKHKIALGAAAAAALILCAWISGLFVSVFSMELNFAFFRCVFLGLFNMPGIIITLLLVLLLLILIIVALNKKGFINEVTEQDEETGFVSLENGTYGSSKWMTPSEAELSYKVGKPEDMTETIYGKLMDGTNRVAARSNKTRGNKNHLILGASGTGKSYCFVRTELMQAIRRGDSIVVTDPKGELYRDLSLYCANSGYVVRQLNLKDPVYSDTWNCLEEVIDKKTGRLKGSRLQSFAHTYITNTQGVGTEQAFWAEGGENLLKAYIGAAAWEREYWIIKAIRQHIDILYGTEERDSGEYLDISEKLSNKMIPLTEAYRILIKASYSHGVDKLDIYKTIEDINNNAPEFSIGKILKDILYRPDNLNEQCAEMPESYPAKMAYAIFEDADKSPQVKASTKDGVKIKLQLFQDPDLRKVMSNKGISVSDTNLKKTAYFLIISDTDTVYKSISSLFFSFLFRDMVENFDQHSKTMTVYPVTIMMDEAYSVGFIPSFSTFLSTCRSRNLYVYMILQNIGQLTELYEEYEANSIISCCDTKYFIGCRDEMTAKFIEFLSGETTVMTQSRQEMASARFKTNTVMNISEGKRPLMTAAEALRYKEKVIVFRGGDNPLKLLQYPYVDHKEVKNGLVFSDSDDDSLKPSAFEGIPVSERQGIKDAISELEHSYADKENIYIRVCPNSFKAGMRVISGSSGEYFVAFWALKKYAAEQLGSLNLKKISVKVYGDINIYLSEEGKLSIPPVSKSEEGTISVRKCREVSLWHMEDVQMNARDIMYAENMSVAKSDEEKLNNILTAFERLVHPDMAAREDNIEPDIPIPNEPPEPAPNTETEPEEGENEYDPKPDLHHMTGESDPEDGKSGNITNEPNVNPDIPDTASENTDTGKKHLDPESDDDVIPISQLHEELEPDKSEPIDSDFTEMPQKPHRNKNNRRKAKSSNKILDD